MPCIQKKKTFCTSKVGLKVQASPPLAENWLLQGEGMSGYL